MRWLIVVVALCAGTSLAAENEFYSGNDFLENCEPTDARPFCMEFVRGFYLGMSHGASAGYAKASGTTELTDRLPQLRICPPNQIGVRQLLDIVIQYTDENPDQRHWPFALLANNAFIKAFPCPAE